VSAHRFIDARHRLEGERKQVTIMFADIKDSTDLIKDLDPEAAQQLLGPAPRRMMDAVHGYEGTVNQVLGDGIMALFGAPIAHEDHALRACYASLAMQAAMPEYTETAGRQVEKAMVRSAYHEAVGYFEEALRPLQHLPERRDTREQAIDLRLALRSALLPSNDSGRILAYLREAEALAAAIDLYRTMEMRFWLPQAESALVQRGVC
jgi:class 3 adenylate cyclase